MGIDPTEIRLTGGGSNSATWRQIAADVEATGGPSGLVDKEIVAMVAYLQMLGTLVDFATFDASGPNLR